MDSPESIDDEVDVDDLETKADALSRPLGIFELSSAAEAGAAEEISLHADRTFHLERADGTQDGTYRFTSSGSYRYVRFHDLDGTLIARYQYELLGDELSLRRVGQSVWLDYTRANPCGDPLFADHPHTGSIVTSHGKTAPLPLHACDYDTTVVFALADADVLRPLVADTGYQPITVQDGLGIVQLFFNKYYVSDLGSFNEFQLAFQVGPESAPAEAPWVNAYSVLVPSFNPANTVFTHKLVLDDQLAIDYGREVYGLDKAAGDLRIVRDGESKLVSVDDARGRTILRGRIPADRSPTAGFAFAQGLAAALGLSGPEQLPPAPEISIFAGANRSVLPGGPPVMKQIFHSRTTAQFGTDTATYELETGGHSVLGRLLGDLALEPVLIFSDEHIKFVGETIE